MREVFELLIIFSFVVKTLRAILFYSQLWQIKEYRLDRIWDHLHTAQGKNLLFGPLPSIKWFLFFSYPLFKFLTYSNYFFYLVLVVISTEAFWSIIHFFRGKVYQPKLSKRVAVVISLSGLSFIALFIWLPFELSFKVILLDRLTAIIIGGLFLVSSLPFFFYQKYMVKKAAMKLRKIKPLIIGITGSYGKTSTKEYLFQILSRKKRVAKTMESKNSLIGVAEAIINDVKEDTEIFIAEMAAYKRGEIAEICRLAKPSIAVITGINQQHLSLFGSLENTMMAKYEIVEFAAENAKVVINGNNKYCLQMAKWARRDGKKVYVFKVQDSLAQGEGFFLIKPRIGKTSLQFTLQLSGYREKVRVSLIGGQHCSNILAASTVASLLGLKAKDIFAALPTLKSPPKNMSYVRGLKNSVWIDDSFNSNPDGVKAAIAHLAKFGGKRILVFQPIIELGESAVKVHRHLGKEAGKVCQQVILTNKNYYQAFVDGFNQTKTKNNEVLLANKKSIDRLVSAISSKDDVVLFEGKEAGKILKYLKQRYRLREQ